MILELKVKNFLSFKDEVTFSFEATRDKSFEDYQVVEIAPNTRILRLAVVYGANASGKSNLLNVFDFLRSFWFDIPEDKDTPTGVIPFPDFDTFILTNFQLAHIHYIINSGTPFWVSRPQKG